MDLRLLGAVPLLIASAAIGNPTPPDGSLPPIPAPAAARKPMAIDPESPPARLRVFVDPRTGRTWEPRGSHVAAPPGLIAFEVLLHPDGTRSVDLQDAFTMNTVVRRNRDGSLSFACVPAHANGQGSPLVESARPTRAEAPAGGEK